MKRLVFKIFETKFERYLDREEKKLLLANTKYEELWRNIRLFDNERISVRRKLWKNWSYDSACYCWTSLTCLCLMLLVCSCRRFKKLTILLPCNIFLSDWKICLESQLATINWWIEKFRRKWKSNQVQGTQQAKNVDNYALGDALHPSDLSITYEMEKGSFLHQFFLKNFQKRTLSEPDFPKPKQCLFCLRLKNFSAQIIKGHKNFTQYRENLAKIFFLHLNTQRLASTLAPTAKTHNKLPDFLSWKTNDSPNLNNNRVIGSDWKRKKKGGGWGMRERSSSKPHKRPERRGPGTREKKKQPSLFRSVPFLPSLWNGIILQFWDVLGIHSLLFIKKETFFPNQVSRPRPTFKISRLSWRWYVDYLRRYTYPQR